METLHLCRLLGFLAVASTWSGTHSHQHQPSYLLLAPRSLQPGVQTSISVTILSSSPVLVSADITLGNQMVAMNSTAVEGGATQLLTLPAIQQDESSLRSPYLLHVKGHVKDVEVFSNKTELTFDPKCFSTFIQTDKPNYCPGQAVRIRVVSLRPDGKPNHSPVNITIRAPRGILLRQWLDVDGVHGVVSKEFQLSENPPLGRWSIVTHVNDVVTEKCFNVAKYALAKLSVRIKAPKRVHRGELLQGSVHAQYVYGKPVRGHVDLTFIRHLRGADKAVHEHMQIDGTADFTFDLLGDQSATNSHLGMPLYDGHVDEDWVSVVVHVTEELTGLTGKSQATVFVATSRYQICFEGYPKMLKPSLNFVATLKISTYNNQLLSLEDRQKPVRVSVMQQKQHSWGVEVQEEVVVGAAHLSNVSAASPSPLEEIMAEEMELPVPADGRIPLSIPLRKDTEILLIDAYFEDSNSSLQLCRTYSSPSHSYLQIQKPPSPVQVGSPVTLSIQSNFPVSEIRYLVKAGGQVVSAGEAPAPLSLLPVSSWAPLVSVLVYCVRPTGEVVNDLIRLPVSPVFNNKVSLSWSQTEVEPGDEVVLRVTAEEPASLVGLLVADKATKWGGSHNDLTEDSVLQQMLQKLSSLDAGDPYSLFKTCDLVVMTDAAVHVPARLPDVWEEGPPLRQGEGQAPEEDEHLQDQFPETWIWKDVHTGDSVSSDVKVTVPDSLTTWVVSAFVVSESLGLGLAEAPVELTVLKDLFLSLNLPACVIRGEELLLEVVLFNYLPHRLEVMVAVAESQMFQFVFPDQGGSAFGTQVFVESHGGASVHVAIRPLVLGEVPVSVNAVTSSSSHSVLQTVVVKAEGLEQFFSSSLLLEVSSSRSSLSRHLQFSFPPGLVMGSERAWVTVVGDLLGPSIGGLDDLIRLPRGCGEQNMINLAPNVYVLKYLSASGQEDPESTARARAYLSTGYEQQLSYQRADGSFSAFGSSDAAGSTWLSAFVLRCFLQARPFIGVDAHVLEVLAAWLSAQQGADGRFEEHGRVIHTELQGGLDGPVSLTAYVLIALMEDPELSAQYGAQVSGALGFLESHVSLGVLSSYSLGLVSYALALSNSSRAPLALQELMGRAELADGGPLWSAHGAGLSWSSWQPRSADIEMVSYALLSHHKLGLIEEAVKLMKWLSQQRNDRGGFRGTQDTVVALQALATLAALTSSRDTNLTVSVSADESAAVAVFHVDQHNQLLQQSRQIEPGEGLHLQVTAEGRGLALFQLNVFYNVWRLEPVRKRRDAHEHEAFHLSVELFDSHPAHLGICCSLVQGLGLKATGMAVVEVGLLSGFVLEPHGLHTDDWVRKVETSPGKVIVYLDSVTTDGACLSVPLLVQNKVAKLQDASVLVYDYYEPARRAARLYSSDWRDGLTPSDLCGGLEGDCPGSVFDSGATPSRQDVLLGWFLPALLVLVVSGF